MLLTHEELIKIAELLDASEESEETNVIHKLLNHVNEVNRVAQLIADDIRLNQITTTNQVSDAVKTIIIK